MNVSRRIPQSRAAVGGQQFAGGNPQFPHVLHRLACLGKVTKRCGEGEQVALGEQICNAVHVVLNISTSP